MKLMSKPKQALKFGKCANNFLEHNMMERFYQWYSRNQDAISWFLIGVLSISGVDALIRENYFWGTWNLLFAFINYKFISIRA
jgi:hypothetical protein